mmetsp:Transcript_7298/g.20584  ORF Transcript_7298/g.20584 Transcript_7298/m.20584 type:complete len:784 (-) Transcript_7298:304-2655(-)|eukprot:CAMPEP_0117667378 /NCGR_PEP_ID=MMETSP0804-20121206/10929_1 /TAXON_ID=1074897 /ORGANISM="Tetraselmis astigmatica, Strain CCMP880" /LENGTH=783 /DNA_ID=CAMNT_0005475089 /DNA_START=60 /DNA_END=2411 /DNA_ORIENTATION=-
MAAPKDGEASKPVSAWQQQPQQPDARGGSRSGAGSGTRSSRGGGAAGRGRGSSRPSSGRPKPAGSGGAAGHPSARAVPPGGAAELEIPSAEDFGADFGGEYERAPALQQLQQASVNPGGYQHHAQQEQQQSHDRFACLPGPHGNGTAHANGFGPQANGAANGEALEQRLANIKAEIGRLSALESEYQRRIDEQSELREAKEALMEKEAQIAELTEERTSFRTSAESERRSLLSQLQEKDREIEDLRQQIQEKDELLRQRDVLLAEHGKQQTERDSNVAAAMDKLSVQEQTWGRKEEEMRKEMAAMDSKFKEREAELINAINEWQRALHAKEEALWHMQGLHTSMERHFHSQINVLAAQKHAAEAELQQLKGGAPGVIPASGPEMLPPGMGPLPPPVSVPLPPGAQTPFLPPATAAGPDLADPQAAPPGLGGAGGAAPVGSQAKPPPHQVEEKAAADSSSAAHWIQSLMTGTANLQATANWAKPTNEEAQRAHHPSLDPRVPAPGHHPTSTPAPPEDCDAMARHPANRLLTDNELMRLVSKAVPEGAEAARRWGSEEDMELENLLEPFNWADHYGPQHGSIIDFLSSNPDVFTVLPDGSVYRHPAASQAAVHPLPPQELTVPTPASAALPVFGTFGVSPAAGGGAVQPVGTPATALMAPMATVVVTPMPSGTAVNQSGSQAPKHPSSASSSSSAATAAPPKGGTRVSASSTPKQEQGGAHGHPESRSRSRRGGGGGGYGDRGHRAPKGENSTSGVGGSSSRPGGGHGGPRQGGQKGSSAPKPSR